MRSGQSQSDQLWLHFLAETKLSRAAEVGAALQLAVDKHFQLVIPGRHVADVNPLHAALAQGLALWRCRCSAPRVGRRSGAARRRDASCRPWPAQRRSPPVSLTGTAVSLQAGSALPPCEGSLI